MKRNTAFLIAGGLGIGAVLLFFYNYQQNQKKKLREEYIARLRAFQQRYGQNYVPPKNSPEWYQWLQLGVNAYGFTRSLFEEGGIFNKKDVPGPEDTEFWTDLDLIP